jgi:hypothetical protein
MEQKYDYNAFFKNKLRQLWANMEKNVHDRRKPPILIFFWIPKNYLGEKAFERKSLT